MKHTILAVSLSLLMTSSAYAGFIGPSDEREVASTVQTAVASGNDTTCVLEGNIVRHTEKTDMSFRTRAGP